MASTSPSLSFSSVTSRNFALPASDTVTRTSVERFPARPFQRASDGEKKARAPFTRS